MSVNLTSVVFPAQSNALTNDPSRLICPSNSKLYSPFCEAVSGLETVISLPLLSLSLYIKSTVCIPEPISSALTEILVLAFAKVDFKSEATGFVLSIVISLVRFCGLAFSLSFILAETLISYFPSATFVPASLLPSQVH